jgi:hypothetical protein
MWNRKKSVPAEKAKTASTLRKKKRNGRSVRSASSIIMVADGNNSLRKRRPHIYIFQPDDLDNDDVILAVENTPTYKRTRPMLEDIRKQGSAASQDDNTNDDKGEAQPSVISFA